MNVKALTVALAAILLTVAANAQQNVNRVKPAPSTTGFRAEFIANLDDVASKYLDLAESIPADKYGWRPAKGVRSISEVFVHVAASNYFLATYAGAKAPAGLDGDMEKDITAKAAVLLEMKKSFEFLRNHARNLTDAQLESAVRMFDSRTTFRGVLLTIISHIHEHLGQAIAYARMNGVVPPWSR